MATPAPSWTVPAVASSMSSGYGVLPMHHPEPVDQLAQPPWTDDAQRPLSSTEPVRLHEARQAQDVVAVQVREEDHVDVDEPETRAQELPLGALAAVDEPTIAAARDEGRGRPARPRGDGRRRAEEGDVKIHGPRSYLRLSRGHRRPWHRARRVGTSPGPANPRNPP